MPRQTVNESTDANTFNKAASPTPPAEQQAAPKAAPGEPSDVEIDDFLDSPACITWMIASNRDRYRLLVRAVLAKWAAPQQEAQEPVAYVHVPHYTVEGKVRPVVSFEKYQQDYDDGIYSTRIPLYTAPQPVVREPLTCEWTHNDDDGYWDTSCGKAWRFDDGGPKENNMNFCHCCGKTLRIKGKEAGNADT